MRIIVNEDLASGQIREPMIFRPIFSLKINTEIIIQKKIYSVVQTLNFKDTKLK